MAEEKTENLWRTSIVAGGVTVQVCHSPSTVLTRLNAARQGGRLFAEFTGANGRRAYVAPTAAAVILESF